MGRITKDNIVIVQGELLYGLLKIGTAFREPFLQQPDPPLLGV